MPRDWLWATQGNMVHSPRERLPAVCPHYGAAHLQAFSKVINLATETNTTP